MSPWLSFKTYNLGRSVSFNVFFTIFIIIFVPWPIALLIIPLLLIQEVYTYYKRKNNFSKTINQIRDLTTEEEFKQMVKNASSEKEKYNPDVQLCKVLTSEISISRQKSDCLTGHSVGCKHYSVTEKSEYDELLNEAIRKGNDTFLRKF